MFDLVLQGERAKKTIDEEFSSTASQRLGIKKIEKNNRRQESKGTPTPTQTTAVQSAC